MNQVHYTTFHSDVPEKGYNIMSNHSIRIGPPNRNTFSAINGIAMWRINITGIHSRDSNSRKENILQLNSYHSTATVSLRTHVQVHRKYQAFYITLARWGLWNDTLHVWYIYNNITVMLPNHWVSTCCRGEKLFWPLTCDLCESLTSVLIPPVFHIGPWVSSLLCILFVSGR